MTDLDTRMDENEKIDENHAESARRAGKLVRQVRRKRGLSLANLAEKSGLSTGLLSQLERGAGNPSFTTIIKISQALNVPASEFFSGLDEAGTVVRAASRPLLQLADNKLVYELMTPNMHGQIGVVKTELTPGFSNEDAQLSHVGEECTIVLAGRIYISVDGTGYELGAGDAITYNSSLNHWYRNESDEIASLLGAMTPPSF
ncbi:helix-turn-helix domain-containing protein [Arthrobacter cryoconiti]|uniref:Helix-turn-helix domain-containing protein n=1 Tax=Arthrobacter cryoconiti TaxID=748907 RepID=A0ABV8QZ68_9MICC|nr:helix-turn-helix domain-containing protein [Arthrobacter cryoconiti]MCC9067629.1 helix-turn-helix domain-containing protein [Arthrobacter cryoconiti]